jgi:hypothetical protein
MSKVSVKSCRENQNKHFVFNSVFFRKSYLLLDNVGKCCIAGQATDDSMAHAHCMLDANGYEHALSEYVILISFLLHQWLHERAVLRYT